MSLPLYALSLSLSSLYISIYFSLLSLPLSFPLSPLSLCPFLFLSTRSLSHSASPSSLSLSLSPLSSSPSLFPYLSHLILLSLTLSFPYELSLVHVAQWKGETGGVRMHQVRREK